MVWFRIILRYRWLNAITGEDLVGTIWHEGWYEVLDDVACSWICSWICSWTMHALCLVLCRVFVHLLRHEPTKICTTFAREPKEIIFPGAYDIMIWFCTSLYQKVYRWYHIYGSRPLTVDASLLECWTIKCNVSTSSGLRFIHLIHHLTHLPNILHLTHLSNLRHLT